MAAWDYLLLVGAQKADAVDADRRRETPQTEAGRKARARYRFGDITGEHFRRDGVGRFQMRCLNLLLEPAAVRDMASDLGLDGVTILWAGDKRGVPMGVTVSGDPEQVSGSPQFPGAELVLGGRTRLQLLTAISKSDNPLTPVPIAPTQTHTFLGWAPRRYDLI